MHARFFKQKFEGMVEKLTTCLVLNCDVSVTEIASAASTAAINEGFVFSSASSSSCRTCIYTHMYMYIQRKH